MLVLVAVLVASLASCSDDDTAGTTTAAPSLDDSMQINQLQLIGSHNSFHVSNFDVLEDVSDLAVTLDYTHEPLPEQLDGGLRVFELDLWQQDGELHVLHFPDFDPISVCDLFTECLGEIQAWSADHDDHVPRGIMIEVKAEAPTFGTAGMDSIDDDIRSVFGADEIIEPDDVRGDAATLAEAVPDGWPTLGEARGQVMFALDNENEIRDLYVEDHPSLEGRAMFTSSQPGRPDAAFIKLNEAQDDHDRIADLVADGYIIRTRTDADLIEAKRGDTERMELAFASGAQWLSSDYPATEPPAPDTGYTVAFDDGGFVRCNPVNAPDGCEDGELEG